jgi:Leucine-rich repeat (LRR) protein
MKKIFVIFSIALLSLNLVFPRNMSNEERETFIIAEDSPIFLSFENYKMKDGWTPLVLSVGELEFLLWLDASGRISGRQEIEVHPLDTVCAIDPVTLSLEKGASKLYFEVYEQNPVRTRWRLSPSQGGKPGTLTKKILFREGGIDLCLGNLRLRLNQVFWEFKEISPGLFQVRLNGPMVPGHQRLVYEKAKGIIYSTHGRNNRLIAGQSRTWSMNPNSTASGSIPPQERAALIALYNSTDGDNWFDNSGWKTPPLDEDGFALPGTENSWKGITCDEGNTTVINIVLVDNNLKGTLPPELGNLANLWALHLSLNQLSGTIPLELVNPGNLHGLNLGWNQLSGPIPPELGNLEYLETLCLSGNQLSGPIPPELGNLAHLYSLFLDSNQLSGPIPPELGNLSNLQFLWLYYNQLSGPIPPELGNLSNLLSISLRYNHLSGSIPSELGNLTKLQELSLLGNQLSGSIPPELGNLANLQMLCLLRNQFSGSIPLELGNLSNLQYLYLDSNKLSGSIPSNLINLENLCEDDSDFRWNALYTNDNILRTFLNSKQIGGNWENTQTVAPANVTATPSSLNSIDISWTPISYTADTGGYRVFYSTTPGGPYTYFGMTANKTESSLTVTGLNPDYTYYFVVKTRTNPHWDNQNTVDSEYGVEVSASTLQRYISGSVTCDGKGLQGVTIDNSEGRTILTDSNGNYNMKVFYGWSGLVTPSMAGYIFSPANRSYDNVTVNQTNQDYTAVLQAITISGAVTTDGKALPGVTITLSNGPTTLTDTNGNYNVTVSYGWSGQVTPSMAGYIFSPADRSYTNITLNISNQDFQASPIKSLTLASPNGGESWPLRTIHNITWTSWGLSGNVWLQLWKNNKKVDDIAANIPITNCSYPWAVGICLKGVVSEGSGYTVKICTKDGLYFDFSNASFSIVR